MTKRSYYILIGLFSLLIGCVSSPTTSTAEEKPKSSAKLNGVRAILSLEDSIFDASLDAYVNAMILNNDTIPFEASAQELHQAILSLVIFNDKGEPVPTIPPSLPLEEENIQPLVIEPSKAFLLTYDLHIFDPMLPTGRYSIQMKNMPSNKVFFNIK